MHEVDVTRNRRILIIDDMPAIHEDFLTILTAKAKDTSALDKVEAAIFGETSGKKRFDGFEVDSAFQGQEALEKVRQALRQGRSYAMAFVDVRMPPGWDGIETISRIWQEDPDIQMVICTAYSDLSWHEIIEKLGRTDRLLILKKPFESIEVYQLAGALTEKWYLGRKARIRQDELQDMVTQRTRQLQQANAGLKKTNEQLAIALEKAREADRAKSEFLANMSHEIRTPMNSVVGFAEILAGENLTEEQHTYVKFIRESARHLLGLIEDILDFAKIGSNPSGTEPVAYSLEQFLGEVESLMKPLATEKGLLFSINRCEGLPAVLKTDISRLRKCLISLLDNAIKFTEKGHVYLNILLEERNNKPYIRFDIEDTGIGIPPDRYNDIFEPFRQVDGSCSRRYGGVGLGLALSKHLAQCLGGSLTMSSDEGKGSVFSLAIPICIDAGDSPCDDEMSAVSNKKTPAPDQCLMEQVDASPASRLTVDDSAVLRLSDRSTDRK